MWLTPATQQVIDGRQKEPEGGAVFKVGGDHIAEYQLQ